MSITVIVPTIGRPSLEAALTSVKAQLTDEDECIVVGSGEPRPEAQHLAVVNHFHYCEEYTPSLWGADRRNLAMGLAKGTHLVFLDDDDVLAPRGLARVRREGRIHPETMLLFRVLHPAGTYFGGKYGHRIWSHREWGTNSGNVMTGCIVVPNVPDLPRWVACESRKPVLQEDVRFAQDCATIMSYEFIDADLVHCRPHVPAEAWQLGEGQ